MKNITLRQFKPSDLKSVLKLHTEGLKQTNSFLNDPEIDRDLHNIEAEYLNNHGEFLVALNDEEIIALGALRKINNQTAEIKRMRVDQKFQGQGIGKMILAALITKARELNYQKLILDVAAHNTKARKFYQKNGFKEFKSEKTNGLKIIFYKLNL